MCGRYTLRRIDLTRAEFEALQVPKFEEFSELRPRFNVAPSQDVPIVYLGDDGHRTLSNVRWGLIPAWTKGKPKVQPINARDDKVLTSPMYKSAMAKRRCLVPADGFYEWKGAKPPKVPMFFRLRDDSVFAFAGLWDSWRPEPGVEPVDTCLHITTTPNALVAPVHDRMPVILHRDDYAQWLDPDVSAVKAAKLLKPYPVDAMEAHAVSTRVNRAGTEGPDLVEPVG